MKKEILPILQCPKTRGQLELKIIKESEDEIIDGILKCGINEYPIENGVMNFLDTNDNYIQQEMMHNYSSRKELEDKFGKDELEDFLVNEALGLTESDYYDTYTRSTMDEFLGKLNLKNSTILEIGGSSGRDLIKYFRHNNNNCVELDINPFLFESSQILIKHNNFYYERVRQDMNILPFKDESFDFVFGSATFHHVDDPSISFKEIYRILKPGGLFYILNERTLSVLKPELKHDITQEMEFAHEHAFFSKEWTEYLEKAGFSVKCIRPQYFNYRRIIERVYGKSKPKTKLGRIRYLYYILFRKLNLNNSNSLLKILQRIEDYYFGNVPYNAVAKK